MKISKVSIIGLGLIGGSLTKALKERLNITEIKAVDLNRQSIDQALAEGYITKGYTEINEDIYDSDLIFLCTPVKNAIEYIKKLSSKVRDNCIITDVASTKCEIVNFINSMDNPPRFIGGHPMAGTEKSGFASSLSHLFENAYYILTPTVGTKEEDINIMVNIIKGIGGSGVYLEVGDEGFAGLAGEVLLQCHREIEGNPVVLDRGAGHGVDFAIDILVLFLGVRVEGEIVVGREQMGFADGIGHGEPRSKIKTNSMTAFSHFCLASSG